METDGGGWTMFLSYHWNKADKNEEKVDEIPLS
jgi:hypothetical protein